MTVSGRKQSTAQVISNPPAPVARIGEEKGKEHEQHMAIIGKRKKRQEDNGNTIALRIYGTILHFRDITNPDFYIGLKI